MDLSKAFDTLDHKILINKLEYYGVRNNELKLLASFLQNRFQYVNIRDTDSLLYSVKTGVSQGSVLGTLLFILYINDFCMASKLFNFIFYADDTTLYTLLEDLSHFTVDKINRELYNKLEWLNINKLSINVKKRKITIFRMPQKNCIVLIMKF